MLHFIDYFPESKVYFAVNRSKPNAYNPNPRYAINPGYNTCHE